MPTPTHAHITSGHSHPLYACVCVCVRMYVTKWRVMRLRLHGCCYSGISSVVMVTACNVQESLKFNATVVFMAWSRSRGSLLAREFSISLTFFFYLGSRTWDHFPMICSHNWKSKSWTIRVVKRSCSRILWDAEIQCGFFHNSYAELLCPKLAHRR